MAEGPKILPPPPVQNASEMTLEMLMRGTQIMDLATWQQKKLPASTLDLKKRGPGTTERPVDKNLMYFSVRSRAVDSLWYRFLCWTDWHGLYAPKELLPASHQLDPVYRDFGLVYGYDDISSEYRIRESAKQLIIQQEGFATDSDQEINMWQDFIVISSATRQPFRFYSLKDWKGLKAPRRLVPGAQRGHPGVRLIDVFSPSELQGKRNVKKAARELIINYEALKAAPKKGTEDSIKPGIILHGEDAATWNTIEAMLAYCDQNAGPSFVARWLLGQVKDRIPPMTEWDALREKMLEEEKRLKAERRRRNKIHKNPEIALKNKLSLPEPSED